MSDADAPIALDPATLRGLAHPLRVRLLNALREHGPSTASRLAERLGQSSGATSYHLRQLAAHGFVAEETDRGAGRERWWRAAHRGTTLDPATARAAWPESEGYLRAVATADFQRVEAALGELPALPAEWQDALYLGTVPLRLTAAAAAELRVRIEELVAGYARGADEDDAAPVTLQFQVLPHGPA